MEEKTGEAKPLDRRSLRTKRAIKHACIKIMTAKEIGDITIKEIAETADINRKTFYAHYPDVHTVFDEIENELIEKILGIIESSDILSTQFNPARLFRELTDEINRDPDFYSCLIRSTTYGKLEAKLKNVVHTHLIDLYEGRLPADPNIIAYVLDFIAAGIASAYREWFNSDRTLTIEDLSLVISTLVSSGVNAVFTPEKKIEKRDPNLC